MAVGKSSRLRYRNNSFEFKVNQVHNHTGKPPFYLRQGTYVKMDRQQRGGAIRNKASVQRVYDTGHLLSVLNNQLIVLLKCLNCPIKTSNQNERSIKKYYKLYASPSDVYNALDQCTVMLEIWTGEKAVFKPEPNTDFSLWDGAIVGKNIKFEVDKLIQQLWYFDDHRIAR
jgi:hypothetical protein